MTLSNFSIKQNKIHKVTLINLKQTLSKFNFNDKATIKCIDDKNIDCLIILDGIIQEERITKLFKNCPDIYEYSKEQKRLDFEDIELKNHQTVAICFEFELNKSGHSSQIIIDTSDEVFIYDNISKKPQKIKHINDIDLYFDKKINEVKNAF